MSKKNEYGYGSGFFGRHVLLAEHRRPVHDLLVVLAVDARADVRRRVKNRLGEGVEDRVRREIVVWVVVGDEDGCDGIGALGFDEADDGLGVFDQEGWVDDHVLVRADYEAGDGGEARFRRDVVVGR